MIDSLTIAAEDPLAQQVSDRLKSLIMTNIEKQGGWISFADYMQACLYQPGLGYYSAGSHKLGQGGDFTTAPETSSLFAYAFAIHFGDVAAQLESYELLEFGAGSGRLAVDLLQQLSKLNRLPERYLILDISADLRQRQHELINKELPDLVSRVDWVSAIPDNFCGVMIANEVCDAMPVHLLSFSEEGMKEQGIGADNGEFLWQQKEIDNPLLLAKAEQIHQVIGTQNYLTELNLTATDWLASVADKLKQGALFIVDYGYPFNEYYRPDRTQGTLRCYFRQQAHDNPLILPGLQDITAHIDFTALAEAAHASGLDVAGFQEQSDFLMAGDITIFAAELEHNSDTLDWLRHSSALKQLLLPGAMGHQFKVLSLTQNISPLARLQLNDRRYQL